MLPKVGFEWELRLFDAFDVNFQDEEEVIFLKRLVRRTDRTVTDGAIFYKWHNHRRWYQFQELSWRNDIRRFGQIPDYSEFEV